MNQINSTKEPNHCLFAKDLKILMNRHLHFSSLQIRKEDLQHFLKWRLNILIFTVEDIESMCMYYLLLIAEIANMSVYALKKCAGVCLVCVRKV